MTSLQQYFYMTNETTVLLLFLLVTDHETDPAQIENANSEWAWPV